MAEAADRELTTPLLSPAATRAPADARGGADGERAGRHAGRARDGGQGMAAARGASNPTRAGAAASGTPALNPAFKAHGAPMRGPPSFRPPPATLRSSALEPVCRFIQIFADGTTTRHVGTRRAVLAKCTAATFGGRAVKIRDADIRLLLGNPLQDDRLMSLKSDGQPLVMLRRERVGICCLGGLRLAVTNEWALIVIPPTGADAHTNAAVDQASEWASGAPARSLTATALTPPAFGTRRMHRQVQEGANTTYAALALYRTLSHSNVHAPEEFAANLASMLRSARHESATARAQAAARDGVTRNREGLSRLSTSLSDDGTKSKSKSSFAAYMGDDDNDDDDDDDDDGLVRPASFANLGSHRSRVIGERGEDNSSAGEFVEIDEPLPFEACVVDAMLEFTGRALLEATQALTLATRPVVQALSAPGGFNVTETTLDAVRKVKNCQASLVGDARANHESLERFLDAADQMFVEEAAAVTVAGDRSGGHGGVERRAHGSVGALTEIAAENMQHVGLLVPPALDRIRSSSSETSSGSFEHMSHLLPLANRYAGPWHATTNAHILEALEGHLRTYAYAKQLLTNVESALQDAEEIANLHLDATRNQLIRLELMLTLAALSIAIYSLVAGVFGMNLPIPKALEKRAMKECADHYWGFIAPLICEPFYWVNMVSAIVSSAVFSALFILWRLKGWV